MRKHADLRTSPEVDTELSQTAALATAAQARMFDAIDRSDMRATQAAADEFRALRVRLAALMNQPS